jgi:hypothetical protein
MRQENDRSVNRRLFPESSANTKDGATRTQSPLGFRNRCPSPQRFGAGRPQSPQRSITGLPPSPRRPVIGQENIVDRTGASAQTQDCAHVRSQSAMARLSDRDVMPPPSSLVNGGNKAYSTEHLNLFLDNCSRSPIQLNGDLHGNQVNPGIDMADQNGCRGS